MKKEKKLSIGQMAKLSGTTIKQLRYYESIGLLKPAFIDPLTSYRYYDFAQTYRIELIRLSIDLGLPLKEFKAYVDEEENFHLSRFLDDGIAATQRSLESLQRRLNLLTKMKEEISVHKKYRESPEIYHRNIEEKYFYCLPFEGTINEVNDLALAHQFIDSELTEEDFGEIIEYGFLYEYIGKEIKRYIFIEVIHYLPDLAEFMKIAPKGTYACKQFQDSQIEKAQEIFGKERILAIEIEIFSESYKIGENSKELRVIEI